MSSPNAFVRFASALSAAIAGALFAMAFTAIKVNNAHYGGVELPVPTYFFARFSGVGFMVPALMLVVFFIVLHQGKRDGIVLDAICAIGWLFALIWSLSCILAWELPYMLIGKGVSVL